MSPDRKVLASLSLALFLLIGGCSGVLRDGPLDQRADQGGVCVPVENHGRITFGYETLENSSSHPVVIDSVRLAQSNGMSVIEALVVVFEDFEEEGGTLVGIAAEYPPEHIDLLDGSAMATGFEIPPSSDSDAVFNLVVGVQMLEDADGATAAGLEVIYEWQGRSYSHLTTNSLELVRGTCNFDN